MRTKPFLKYSFVIPVCLQLAACGGSSSSVEPVTTPPETPPADTQQPQASILFPSKVARVEGENTIWVTGVASDESGVETVTVNGVSAELTPMAPENTQGGDTTAVQSVTWQANIPVSSELTISVTDSAGNVNAEAASSTLYSGDVPTAFTVDNVNHRLYGFKWGSADLITIDLNSGVQELVPSNDAVTEGLFLVYASEENVLVTSNYNFDGGMTLYAIDPVTTAKTELTTYNVPANHGELSFFHISGLDYAAPENSVYVHLTQFYSETQNRSHIVKYDLNQGEMSVVVDGEFIYDIDPNDSEIHSGADIYSHNVLWSEEGLYISNSAYLGNHSYNNTGIQRLVLDESKMEQISDYSTYFLQSDSTNSDLIYAVDFEGMHTIDVTTGEVVTVSADAEQSELNISQPRIVEHDSANQRLLVHDSALEMVMAIDTETGARSRFIHNGVGQGRNFIYPKVMALDEENEVLYTFDDGGNGPEVIMAIDLNTGNRQQVGNVDHQYNTFVEDLQLDKEQGKLYAFYSDSILEVDIASGETQTILTTENSGLPADAYITRGTLDTNNNQLLVLIAGSLDVYALDLDSYTASVFVELGDAPVPQNDQAYVSKDITMTDEQSALMLSIVDDVASVTYIGAGDGVSTTAQNVCADNAAFQNELPDSPFELHNRQPGEVILKGFNSVFSYDLSTQTCDLIWEDTGRVRSLLDIAVSTQGQWYYSAQAGVYQLEIESGQSVVLSK